MLDCDFDLVLCDLISCSVFLLSWFKLETAIFIGSQLVALAFTVPAVTAVLFPGHFVLLYSSTQFRTLFGFGELVPEAVFRRTRTPRTSEFHPRTRRLCRDKRALAHLP